MRVLPLMLAACLCCVGCKKKGDEVGRHSKNRHAGEASSSDPDLPMIGAVMRSKTDKVRQLAEKGVGLDERAPEDQSTPMINAAQTDQWPVVEILLDHGADIWAHDEFGDVVGSYILNSHILRGSLEDAARLRVIEKLKARGCPLPPPGRDEILALDRAGRWPPPEARR